jgi:hypothetical protein
MREIRPGDEGVGVPGSQDLLDGGEQCGVLVAGRGASVSDGSAQDLLGSFGQFVECVDHQPYRALKFHQPQRGPSCLSPVRSWTA